jgi:hypothetical protein
MTYFLFKVFLPHFYSCIFTSLFWWWQWHYCFLSVSTHASYTELSDIHSSHHWSSPGKLPNHTSDKASNRWISTRHAIKKIAKIELKCKYSIMLYVLTCTSIPCWSLNSWWAGHYTNRKYVHVWWQLKTDL